jgi:hypothetical protein
VTDADPDGSLMFVRYAYPPNALGYCGPPDPTAFRDYAVAASHGQHCADQDVVKLAKTFTGAWPYLEQIAGASGIDDPLDHRVVEAYWVGNDLLDAVPLARGGAAHHSFHVFCVYPWAAMLPDDRKAKHALAVLDRCRIRWGQVTAITGDHASIDYQPLTWDGHRVALGEPAHEVASVSVDGASIAGEVRPGDWVALHWDWVCGGLTTAQLDALRTYTVRHLDLVNDRTD